MAATRPLEDPDAARLERARNDEISFRDEAPEQPNPDETEVDLNDPEIVEAMEGGGSVTTLPDGMQEFSFDRDESALSGSDDDQGFDANLAVRMTQSERSTLADLVVQFHDVDIMSRQDWTRMREKAMTLLGVKEIDAQRLPFPGAAQVYHPVLAEAVVQFQSNAIEEFFPATGPVKGALAGDTTDENQAQVDRAETFMNYYLTELDKGYYGDVDQELFVLPIDGSTFRKVYVDPIDGMPKSRMVRSDDLIAPYFCTDMQLSPRYIHRYQMTGEEIDMAIMRGAWMDTPLPFHGDQGTEDDNVVKDASDRRKRVLHDQDKLYTIYEAHLMRDLPENVDELVEYDEDGNHLFMPSYVVYTIKETRETPCIVRLWAEEDPEHTKELWFSHKKFLPGLGFYGWGFPHVIGALAEAATGAERALLDSALMATMQGGFRAKDGVKDGASMTIEPGKYKDVDSTAEELQKTFFNPPFKEPSPALFQMLQAIVQDARRFASITEVLTGQANNKAPVGTTIALIEQSMKLFTAIHKRIFAAARQEFAQLAKLIYRHAPFEQYPYYLKGEQQVMLKSDFDERVDFIPVADPNIISSVQRIAIAQAVLELANSRPDLYGAEQMVTIHTEFLKALKVPYADKIAPKTPKPTYVDAVTENAMMMVNTGVKAFPGQAHQAHIMLHQRAVMGAQGQLPPDQFEPLYMNFMTHIREHMALMLIEVLSTQMQQQIGVPMPPIDIFANEEDMDPKLEMAVTMMASRLLPQMPQLPAPGGQEEPAPDPVAEAEQKAKALEVETMAKIDRQTTEFAAKHHQDAERHTQELQQADEIHRQKLKQMGEESASKIIRENAAHISTQRQTAAQTALKIAQEGRAGQMRSRLEKEGHQHKVGMEHEAHRHKLGMEHESHASKLNHEKEAHKAKVQMMKEQAKAKPKPAKPNGKDKA